MSGTGFDRAVERAWQALLAIAGRAVTVRLIEAGPYDPDTGEHAGSEDAREVSAVVGPVHYRAVQTGIAQQGDLFVQVRVADLPRPPRPDDLIDIDGETWKVASPVLIHATVAEAVVRRT